MKIDIIFPVLNEEKRLVQGIEKTLKYLLDNDINHINLIIADNGSTDDTEKLANEIIKNNNKIKYIKLTEKGVGLALRKGIEISNADIVGYMDIDLSTDINHLKEVINIFESQKDVDIVIGSRNLSSSKVKNRSIVRNITSNGLSLIINKLLGTTKTDYMCGFKFFKRERIIEIIKKASAYKGWFYCAEIVVIAEWLKYKIIEIPVLWLDDRENSKVNGKLLKITNEYLKQIYLLRAKKNHINRVIK